MNTKPLPAIVTLLAGLVTCAVSIIKNFEYTKTLTTLLIVLLSFYVLGSIFKLILDLVFNSEKEAEGKELEDIEENKKDSETVHEENTKISD